MQKYRLKYLQVNKVSSTSHQVIRETPEGQGKGKHEQLSKSEQYNEDKAH
jgi:hypothetical protein